MMHVLAAASSTQQGDLLSRIFVFERYGELVQLLQNSRSEEHTSELQSQR